MSREQAKQRLFQDDRYRMACHYGFPLYWYELIRHDFPEVEIAYDLQDHKMKAFALTSGGLAHVVDTCMSSDDAPRLYDRLVESRGAALSDGLKQWIAQDRKERDAKKQASTDKALDKLDPTKWADDYRKSTGVKGATVSLS